MSDHWLESLAWFSQGCLLPVAFWAAYVALRQLQSYKLLELMKYIEDEEFRTFRRIVIMEIAPLGRAQWWQGSGPAIARLEQAAAAVCGRYDVLGLMIEADRLERWFPKTGYGVLFAKNWSGSIIRAHDALEGYLHHRRSTGVPGALPPYCHFTNLRNAALKAIGR